MASQRTRSGRITEVQEESSTPSTLCIMPNYMPFNIPPQPSYLSDHDQDKNHIESPTLVNVINTRPGFFKQIVLIQIRAMRSVACQTASQTENK